MRADLTDYRYWPGWRMLLALAAAMLLPLLIYALIIAGISYRNDRQTTQAATLERAQRIAEAIDARLDAVTSAMRTLATVRSIGERNWREARSRAAEIAAFDPDWRDVALVDLAAGVELFDLRAARGAGRRVHAAALARVAAASRARPSFGDIVPGPAGPEVHAYLGVGPGARPAYLLDVALDPRLVQRILLAEAPRRGLSAVVDRRGMFLARTQAWRARLGTPGTRYVLAAIRAGSTGFYKGVTWEGLANYAAFATSPRTGWSSHVAVASTLIDGPQLSWRLATLAAAGASLLLAGLLIALLLYVIAARRRADVRQQQSERLAAVGQLSGGIAHDFNNMLAIVIGSLDLARRRLARGDADVGRHLDNAMEGAERAAELTRRLLAFARRQPLAPALVDVNALIEGMRALLERTLSGHIRIETALAPDLWPAFVDPGQLENALVNLAVNARDAMPDGGTLTIATANRAGALAGRAAADAVEIAVGDTGSGMTPEVAARAFEPFFTTKEVGRGTGLGLSQLHGFATQSGGDARLASRAGAGTTVSLLLPRHHPAPGDAAPVARGARDEAAPAGRADEVILLVEDEALVRRTNVEALRSLGYTVRAAASAGEALAMLEAEPAVRLLLTDIVMPGMSGRDLAERVGRRYPALRILLVSGFEGEEAPADEHRILRKPFSVGELARRVRTELDVAA